MAVLPIYVYGSKVLRKRATEVEKVTPELKRFAKDMIETMYKSNGLGLAAPQVGKSIRLIVVDISNEEEKKDPQIFFNPIVKEGKNPVTAEEGCLSVPGVWADVKRPGIVTLEAMDENGKLFEKEIDGMFARCVQHEIDHLDGVLFVDKISATDRVMNEKKLKSLAKEAKSLPA